jgi:hypothetical protein
VAGRGHVVAEEQDRGPQLDRRTFGDADATLDGVHARDDAAGREREVRREPTRERQTRPGRNTRRERRTGRDRPCIPAGMDGAAEDVASLVVTGGDTADGTRVAAATDAVGPPVAAVDEGVGGAHARPDDGRGHERRPTICHCHLRRA